MPETTIETLDGVQADAAIAELCNVMADCVNDGASIGYMLPYGPEDALPFWQGVARGVADGAIRLIVAKLDGRITGTVQLALAQPPNQPHRADLRKLMVRRSARGLGQARRLMQAAETEALACGRRVLVLDTATGSDAEAIYLRLGWQRVGVIPDYALFPDGRFCDSTFFYKALAA